MREILYYNNIEQSIFKKKLKYSDSPTARNKGVLALDRDRLVIVDEVQKVPVLLDEIHYCIQEQNRVFGLWGSSIDPGSNALTQYQRSGVLTNLVAGSTTLTFLPLNRMIRSFIRSGTVFLRVFPPF